MIKVREEFQKSENYCWKKVRSTLSRNLIDVIAYN